MKTPTILVLAVALAACSGEPATHGNTAIATNEVEAVPPSESDVAVTGGNAVADTATPAAAWTQDRYIGRWKGVEGMYLNVAAKPGGGVALDMRWDLDHSGKFDGSVTAEGLRFTRGGVAEVAVPGDGDATGLKWLAGKTDCLTVKPGEGYCRD